MRERYICVHGHFYQPPRQNPWTGVIERQPTADPYHDWNERISAEAYAPNARAKILATAEHPEMVFDNYSRMSFNFGPTLLSWLERHDHGVYKAVIEADKQSSKRYGGHGSALAQAYNHMIMPLANLHDKQTQVIWGIKDFEYRFARKPDGMWLPETAVDTETLEVLAEAGIRFTILAPHQAAAVRAIGASDWTAVAADSLDMGRPYRVSLPSGRDIAVFFYSGPVSRSVAFEGALNDGAAFARRLLALSEVATADPQLLSIAVDGETFGHHHRFGEMALAFAMQLIEGCEDARLTNYAQFLERYPPRLEVRIAEKTSWSCAHGIERWRSDCGCKVGRDLSAGQAWRKPLREALDWLRDALIDLHERHTAALLKDCWRARDGYIEAVLDPSSHKRGEFLHRHARRPLNARELDVAIASLKIQEQAMLMFTSCGWFFDDVAGIETVQVLSHAACAIDQAKMLERTDLEMRFLGRLAAAKSGDPVYGDGAQVYGALVKPRSRVTVIAA